MQKKEEIDKALVTASSQNSSQSVYQQELVIYLIIKLLLVFAHTSRKCFKDLYLFRLLIQEIVRSGFHKKKKKKASRYVHISNERDKSTRTKVTLLLEHVFPSVTVCTEQKTSLGLQAPEGWEMLKVQSAESGDDICAAISSMRC